MMSRSANYGVTALILVGVITIFWIGCGVQKMGGAGTVTGLRIEMDEGTDHYMVEIDGREHELAWVWDYYTINVGDYIRISWWGFVLERVPAAQP